MNDWGNLPPITIDDDSDVPKYQQFAQALEAAIVSRAIRPQSRLPSENELFELLGLSRSTIRKGLELVEARGLIVRRQGQGTYTAPPERLELPEGAPPRPPLAPLAAPRSSGGGGAHGLIGLLLPSMTNEIYPQIVRGVEDVAALRGCSVFIANTYVDRSRELALLGQMLDRGVDGIIFEPTNAVDDAPDSDTYRFLQHAPVPVVLLDNDIPGIDLSRVMIDDVEGGRLAARHLAGLGHRRIGMVYPRAVLPGLDRLAGYRRALAEAGLPYDPALEAAYEYDSDNPADIQRAVRGLLSLADRPTGICFFNDEGALQGLPVIHELGLAVPRDVSVVGFDNVLSSGSTRPPLTTVEHPKYFCGRWAADILFDLIDGRSPAGRRRLMVYPELVVRESTARR